MNFALIVEPIKGSKYIAGPFRTKEEAHEWIDKSFSQAGGHPGIREFTLVRLSPVSKAQWTWTNVEPDPVV